VSDQNHPVKWATGIVVVDLDAGRDMRLTDVKGVVRRAILA
jgi:hypothetical protein